jgi:hypothetical protein
MEKEMGEVVIIIRMDLFLKGKLFPDSRFWINNVPNGLGRFVHRNGDFY